MINATQLPPIDGAMDMDPEQQAMMEEMHYQMEMEGVDEYGQEMEMEPEEQYQEEDQDVGFGDLKAIFRADEMKGKDHVAETRKANFISKGSYIWNMLMQIETGEQAISFFAKYGQSTPIKFVKFKRKPVSPDQFRPYDLVKVDEEDDNPRSQETEYFTISAQGVVHVQFFQRKGSGVEQVPTEFMTLSQWMHQSTLFNVLTSMNFFKHYLIGKVFALWKGNVRFKMFNRTRQALAKSLI
jgi:dynein heavy chain, axonemal